MGCFMWVIHTSYGDFMHCYGPTTASFLQQGSLITIVQLAPIEDSYLANAANPVLQTSHFLIHT